MYCQSEMKDKKLSQMCVNSFSATRLFHFSWTCWWIFGSLDKIRKNVVRQRKNLKKRWAKILQGAENIVL